MALLDLQRQLRTLGRIRTGVTAISERGKAYPSKLDTFRLTAKSRELIDAAAEAFGGDVRPWQNPAGGAEWEVITRTATLDIFVPPAQPVTQWMEMWSGGGCARRCDGRTNVLDMTPCACPKDPAARLELAKDGEACKTTTRLNLILPALPDLGVWLLESHGYYAAVELAGAAELLAMAAAAETYIPARLRLDQREKRVPGQPTRKWAVPVIEMVQTRIAAAALAAPAGERAGLLAAGVRPARPALPATTAPATSDFRAPGPSAAADGLTTEQLLERLDRAGISRAAAVDWAARRWGADHRLNDQERAELLDEMQQELAELAGY